jgi:hypothetical protein
MDKKELYKLVSLNRGKNSSHNDFSIIGTLPEILNILTEKGLIQS